MADQERLHEVVIAQMADGLADQLAEVRDTAAAELEAAKEAAAREAAQQSEAVAREWEEQMHREVAELAWKMARQKRRAKVKEKRWDLTATAAKAHAKEQQLKMRAAQEAQAQVEDELREAEHEMSEMRRETKRVAGQLQVEEAEVRRRTEVEARARNGERGAKNGRARDDGNGLGGAFMDARLAMGSPSEAGQLMKEIEQLKRRAKRQNRHWDESASAAALHTQKQQAKIRELQTQKVRAPAPRLRRFPQGTSRFLRDRSRAARPGDRCARHFASVRAFGCATPCGLCPPQRCCPQPTAGATLPRAGPHLRRAARSGEGPCRHSQGTPPAPRDAQWRGLTEEARSNSPIRLGVLHWKTSGPHSVHAARAI